MTIQITLTALTSANVTKVASIHRTELSGFLPLLGKKFLAKFYEHSMDIPELFTFVAKQDGRVVGFVTGVTNPNGLYKKIIFRDPLWFGLFFLRYFVTHPHRVVTMIKTLLYPGFSSNEAELLTLAVDNNYRLQGIGRKLLQKTSEEFKKRGIHSFRISVYDRLASNAFYKKIGCKREKQFTFLGEKMNYYRYKTETK